MKAQMQHRALYRSPCDPVCVGSDSGRDSRLTGRTPPFLFPLSGISALSQLKRPSFHLGIPQGVWARIFQIFRFWILYRYLELELDTKADAVGRSGQNCAWFPHVRAGGLSLWVVRSLRFSACAGRSRSGEVGATTPNHRVSLCLIKKTVAITTRVLLRSGNLLFPGLCSCMAKCQSFGRCHEDKRGDVPRAISFLEARISPLWVVLEPPFLSNGWGLYPSHRVQISKQIGTSIGC